MSNLPDDAGTAAPFAGSQRVAISTLNPSRNGEVDGYIEATIVLVWPYSSSNKKLSLLLAENDVRLRRSKGQVRVTFAGECAREVAKTHAGIGDTIKLSLQEMSWKETGEAVSTPGRKVNWDLEICKSVTIEVRRKNEDPVFLNFRAQTPPPVREFNVQPSTVLSGITAILSRQPISLPATPKIRTPLRVSSGTYIGASLVPFADDDDYIRGRSQKRTKYARHSGSWRLLDGASSEEDLAEDQFPPRTRLPPEPLSPRKNLSVGAEEQISPTDEAIVVSNVADTAMSAGHQDQTDVETGVQDAVQKEPADDLGMAISTIPSFPQVTRMLPSLLPNLVRPVPSPAPVLNPIPSPLLPLVSPMMQQSDLSSGYLSAIPLSQYTADQSLEATNHAVLSNLASPQSVDLIDKTSMVARHTESSTHGSEAVEERDNIAEELEMFQKTDIISSDVDSDEPSKGFDNSDIRGLGDAYLDLSGDLVDLDALQRDIEQIHDTELQPTILDTRQEATAHQTRPPALDAGLQTILSSSPPGADLDQRVREDGQPPEDLRVLQNYNDQTVQPPDILSDKGWSNFDGTDSAYEQESQRVDTRALEIAKSLDKPVSFVEISSDEREPTNEYDDAHESDVHDRGEVHQRDENASLLDGENSHIASYPPHTLAQKLYTIIEHSDAADSSKETGVDTRLLVLTPSATQQTINDQDVVEVDRTLPTSNLPLSPQLTQPLTEADDIIVSQDAFTEPDLPELPPISEPTRFRPSLGRLTRTHFSSDTIGNEYFTPRKSDRATKLHPDEFTDGLRSEPPPSSPQYHTIPGLNVPLPNESHLTQEPEPKPLHNAGHVKKANLQPSLSTDLSYYPRLALINEFYGQEVDIIAICAVDSTEAVRANSGPRDYHTTIRLVDQSYDTDARAQVIVSAQIFRPRKVALPTCRRGDAILLRNVKVQQQNLMPSLLSTDTSAWAVFSNSLESTPDVTIDGPPVEYDEAETMHIDQLLHWWENDGSKLVADSLPSSKSEEKVKRRTPDMSAQGSSSRQSRGPEHPGQELPNRIGISGQRNPHEPPTPRMTRSQLRRRKSLTPVEHAKSTSGTSAIAIDTTASQSEAALKRNDTSLSSHEVNNTSNAHIPISPTMSTRSMRSTQSRGMANNPQPPENAIPTSSTTTKSSVQPDQTTPSKRKKRNRKKSDSNVPLQPSSTQSISKDTTSSAQDQNQNQPHELRDGTKYTDKLQPRGRNRHPSKDNTSSSTVHELRGGVKYTD